MMSSALSSLHDFVDEFNPMIGVDHLWFTPPENDQVFLIRAYAFDIGC